MTDLDIQIDVPDDDDLGSPVRVVNGDSIPPWLKVAAVMVLAGLAVLIIGAFVLGRLRSAGDPLAEPTVPTTPIASAEATPAIQSTLDAIQSWEQFARDGDLTAISFAFDPAGPQYAMFRDSALPSVGSEVDFGARNLSETHADDVTTVSLDLIVTDAGASQNYPFDFVFLNGSTQVWTVIDRRSPGTVALPPEPEVVEVITGIWEGYKESMALGDGNGVVESVSVESQVLGDQVAAAVDGNPVDQPVITDRPLFDLLVSRARQSTATDSGQALIAILDEDQREALLTGELTSWTQTGNGRIIASLELAGQPITTVPFVASDDGWSFDLKGALESSGGSQ